MKTALKIGDNVIAFHAGFRGETQEVLSLEGDIVKLSGGSSYSLNDLNKKYSVTSLMLADDYLRVRPEDLQILRLNIKPIETSLAEQINNMLKCSDFETREQLLEIITEDICLVCLGVSDGHCCCSNEE